MIPAFSPYGSIATFTVLVVFSTVGPLRNSDAKETLAVENAAGTARGVLLLRTEGVIEGAVSRMGDWYYVRQPNGAELEIRANRVAGFYRTLHEAYQSRKPRDRQATPRRHLALAHWCLEQELIAEAQEQLAAARRLPGLEGEKLRLEKELRKNTIAANLSIQTNKANPLAVATTSPVQNPPAKEFPIEVRQDFVRSIQPMLIRNCYQCHEADSGRAFRLSRAALNGSGDAQLIGENFVAVTAFIDSESMPQSELLAFALEPHGGQSEDFAKLSKPLRRHQMNLLRDWCYAVFEVAKPGEPDESESLVEPGDRKIAKDASRPIQDEFDPQIFNRRTRQAESVGVETSLDE